MRCPRLHSVLCLLVLLPVGCKKTESKLTTAPTHPDAAPAEGVAASDGNREISTNPAVLLDPAVKPGEFQWHGIKIGDPATVIPTIDATTPDDSGWIGFKGKANVFRLEGDKVVAISIADDAVLAGLGVKTEADVANRFGKPDQQIEAAPDAPEATYLFNARGLTVLWSRAVKKVTTVTIGS